MELHIHPTFTVLAKEFSIYSLLMIAGFLMGGLLAILRGKKYGIKKVDLLLAAICAAVGGIVGAKLLAIITSIPQLVAGKIKFIDLLFSGFVFYGGLVGGIGGLLLGGKLLKLNQLELFDTFAPSVPFGHAIGRIGCFFGGCCFGMELPAGSSFSLIYPEWYAQYGTNVGVPLLPMQLIEAGLLLILYAVLELLFHFTKKKGVSLFTYVFAYGVIRFVLEFFRGDTIRGVGGGLSTSQWISLALIAGAGVLLALMYFLPRRKKKENND